MVATLPEIPVRHLVDEFLAKKEYEAATTLCAIMTSFGSDKGIERHNYTTLYSKLFTPLKNEDINLFELGIGKNFPDIPHAGPADSGASLYGWSVFFPNGRIYGADIEKEILFNEKNIKTYYCDQCDAKSVQDLFSQNDLKNMSFDIIIEDGKHEFSASLNFLLYSIHKLKKGGIYVIEDLNAVARMVFIQILPELKKSLDLKYINIISIPFKQNRFDNALLVIQK